MQYINTAAQQGVNALVVSANDPTALCDSLNEAKEAGTKVVTFDSDVDPECRDLYISQATSEGIAKTQLDLIAEQIGDSGEIAVLSAKGDGKTRVGDVIGARAAAGPGAGTAAAAAAPPGKTRGADYYEAEVNIDELAALIFEDLQLPFLEEKAKKAVPAKTTRFNEIRRTGVMANLDKRRHRSWRTSSATRARSNGRASATSRRKTCASRPGKRIIATSRTPWSSP